MQNQGKPSLDILIALIICPQLMHQLFILKSPKHQLSEILGRSAFPFPVQHLSWDIHNPSFVVTNFWCITEALKWRSGVQSIMVINARGESNLMYIDTFFFT